MRSFITKLISFLNKGDEIKAEAIREGIAESIDEAVEEEIFFSLPTSEIIKIIQKSNISNAETYSNIINGICDAKGGEAALVLNAVNAKEATFEECVKIISSLKCSSVCVRLGDLYTERESFPERDYQYELEQEIKGLKQKIRTNFEPVTEKPADFESNIHKAAEEGKLTSVQYLYEQSIRPFVVASDDEGMTPLHSASFNGHIEVVKYLIEQCHANVEEKDNSGWTPLHYASVNGQIEVAKYLIEQCHANVEAKDNDGNTPFKTFLEKENIEVIKYLFEQCYENVEAKDNEGRTPLHYASKKNQIEVVKYLIKQCHADIEAKDNKGMAPLDHAKHEGREYLESLVH